MVIAVEYSAILQLEFYSWKVFSVMSLAFLLVSICNQTFGHMSTIMFNDNFLFVFLLRMFISVLFGGFFVPVKEMSTLQQYIVKLIPDKAGLEYIIVYLYGFYKCPSGEPNAIMTMLEFTDDLHYENLYTLLFLCLFFILINYVVIKIKTKYFI